MVKVSNNLSDNRWFIWTIVFLVVSGVSLVSYIAISDTNQYDSTDVGIQVNHPEKPAQPVTNKKATTTKK
jgi:hypothetical protein